MEPERKAADQINDKHRELTGLMKATIDTAIEIGRMLDEQKQAIGHGGWLPWVRDNLDFSERWARDYMRFYRERDKLKTAQVADLSEARELLTEPKAEDLKTRGERLIQEQAKIIEQAVATNDMETLKELLVDNDSHMAMKLAEGIADKWPEDTEEQRQRKQHWLDEIAKSSERSAARWSEIYLRGVAGQR